VTPNFYARGNHCFTPTEALDYARQRDLLANGDSDYGRQRHQQQLLKAILKQVVRDGLNSPTRLPGLIAAVGRAMTVDDGGIPLADWAFAMRSIDPNKLVMLKTNAGTFNSRSVPGIGDVEILDGTSMAMVRAAKQDDLAAFVAAHPSWVARG
jgi:anionic cell wall polymer biosynthesis LytR-Cps2A-Psr (LCP) family protein